jgi:hypothetical protein
MMLRFESVRCDSRCVVECKRLLLTYASAQTMLQFEDLCFVLVCCQVVETY